jgi:hypothetical protein
MGILYKLILFRLLDLALVSEWLLFNANSAIFQLNHGENMLNFNEMMINEVRFVLDQYT